MPAETRLFRGRGPGKNKMELVRRKSIRGPGYVIF